MDRNTNRMESSRAANWSLSARRAWIEIDSAAVSAGNQTAVALRKESVDRNNSYRSSFKAVIGRSPQGERG